MTVIALSVIRSYKCILKTEGDQPALLRARLPFAGCFKNCDAGSLCADERSCDVEAILRKQLVQVITRDTPKNLREPLPYEICIGLTQPSEAG